MPRIQPIRKATPEMETAFQRHIADYKAKITNMKATLGHSLLAFEVYMQWYPLYEKVKAIIGERTAYLFAYSISSASNCPLCSTFFRKIIIDAGGKPGAMILNEYENRLVDFGSAIAQDKGNIPDSVYDRVAKNF